MSTIPMLWMGFQTIDSACRSLRFEYQQLCPCVRQTGCSDAGSIPANRFAAAVFRRLRWVGNVCRSYETVWQPASSIGEGRNFRWPARSATLGFWCLCYSCSSWSPVLVWLTLVGLSILFILLGIRCLQRALWWQTVAIADVQPS